jgi:hypothetical protein
MENWLAIFKGYVNMNEAVICKGGLLLKQHLQREQLAF